MLKFSTRPIFTVLSACAALSMSACVSEYGFIESQSLTDGDVSPSPLPSSPPEPSPSPSPVPCLPLACPAPPIGCNYEGMVAAHIDGSGMCVGTCGTLKCLPPPPPPSPSPSPSVTVTPSPSPSPSVTVTPSPSPSPSVTVTPSPSPSPTIPPQVICDPLDPKNVIDPKLGIKSELHYLEDYTNTVKTSIELRAKGKKVDAEVYLSELNITPRNFTAGFSNQNGSLLRKESGQTLDEWFSLHGESQLQLKEDEEEGYYQFATIADDGTFIEAKNAAGNWNTLINDDTSPHSARMRCSSAVVKMEKGKKVAMRYGYYQGPRVRIAMMLLWRKVDPSAIPAETECSQSRGDDYFFDGSKLPPQPKAPYNAVLSRGWKPLEAGNFLLIEGTNKCVMK